MQQARSKARYVKFHPADTQTQGDVKKRDNGWQASAEPYVSLHLAPNRI